MWRISCISARLWSRQLGGREEVWRLVVSAMYRLMKQLIPPMATPTPRSSSLYSSCWPVSWSSCCAAGLPLAAQGTLVGGAGVALSRGSDQQRGQSVEHHWVKQGLVQASHPARLAPPFLLRCPRKGAIRRNLSPTKGPGRGAWSKKISPKRARGSRPELD